MFDFDYNLTEFLLRFEVQNLWWCAPRHTRSEIKRKKRGFTRLENECKCAKRQMGVNLSHRHQRSNQLEKHIRYAENIAKIYRALLFVPSLFQSVVLSNCSCTWPCVLNGVWLLLRLLLRVCLLWLCMRVWLWTSVNVFDYLHSGWYLCVALLFTRPILNSQNIIEVKFNGREKKKWKRKWNTQNNNYKINDCIDAKKIRWRISEHTQLN